MSKSVLLLVLLRKGLQVEDAVSKRWDSYWQRTWSGFCDLCIHKMHPVTLGYIRQRQLKLYKPWTTRAGSSLQTIKYDGPWSPERGFQPEIHIDMEHRSSLQVYLDYLQVLMAWIQNLTFREPPHSKSAAWWWVSGPPRASTVYSLSTPPPNRFLCTPLWQ